MWKRLGTGDWELGTRQLLPNPHSPIPHSEDVLYVKYWVIKSGTLPEALKQFEILNKKYNETRSKLPITPEADYQKALKIVGEFKREEQLNSTKSP